MNQQEKMTPPGTCQKNKLLLFQMTDSHALMNQQVLSRRLIAGQQRKSGPTDVKGMFEH